MIDEEQYKKLNKLKYLYEVQLRDMQNTILDRSNLKKDLENNLKEINRLIQSYHPQEEVNPIEVYNTHLKSCPFCGKFCYFKEIAGDPGYYPPKIRVTCSNCFCRTELIDTEEYTKELGHYSVLHLTCMNLIKLWNERV